MGRLPPPSLVNYLLGVHLEAESVGVLSGSDLLGTGPASEFQSKGDIAAFQSSYDVRIFPDTRASDPGGNPKEGKGGIPFPSPFHFPPTNPPTHPPTHLDTHPGNKIGGTKMESENRNRIHGQLPPPGI